MANWQRVNHRDKGYSYVGDNKNQFLRRSRNWCNLLWLHGTHRKTWIHLAWIYSCQSEIRTRSPCIIGVGNGKHLRMRDRCDRQLDLLDATGLNKRKL
jgi:hypothetical protein